MKALISAGLAAGLAISLATAANATPTLVGTTTNPTGIDGLVVDGTIYNVTFSTTTLNSFTPGSTLSLDADAALASALNALSVTNLADESLPKLDLILIDIDNTLSSYDGPVCDTCTMTADWSSGSGWNAALGAGPDRYTEAADFTAVGTVSVPEPLTLSLFGAGLAGAAATRRRKAKH